MGTIKIRVWAQCSTMAGRLFMGDEDYEGDDVDSFDFDSKADAEEFADKMERYPGNQYGYRVASTIRRELEFIY